MVEFNPFIFEVINDKEAITSYILLVSSTFYTFIKQNKQTHRYRKQTSGYQRGEERGGGQVRGMGIRDSNYYV